MKFPVLTADSPEKLREQLRELRRSLPNHATQTIRDEIRSMGQLLESLARTSILVYPITVEHIGEDDVPDFIMKSGRSRIEIEMAKVAIGNLEHARSLQWEIQSKTPERNFVMTDIHYPENFARRLKMSTDPRVRFVEGRMPQKCRAWLSTWRERDGVPDSMKSLMVDGLNSIIDGPPIGEAPALAFFPLLLGSETARERKSWLEEFLWEDLATSANLTLCAGRFIEKDDSQMLSSKRGKRSKPVKRDELVERAFGILAENFGGPSIEEELEIWLNKFASEVEQKSVRLNGKKPRAGCEDWLVLWDRFGTQEIDSRAEAATQLLSPKWRPGWFSRIFLQSEYFEWQLMFTPGGCEALPME